MDEEKTTRDARKGSFQWDMYRIGVVAIWGAAIYLLFFYSFPWGDFYDWSLFEAWEDARYRDELFWYLAPYQWPSIPPWQVLLEWTNEFLIILGALFGHGLLKASLLGFEFPNSSKPLSNWRRLFPSLKGSFAWEVFVLVSPFLLVTLLGGLAITYWFGPLVLIAVAELFKWFF